jgi:hypothetical protein
MRENVYPKDLQSSCDIKRSAIAFLRIILLAGVVLSSGCCNSSDEPQFSWSVDDAMKRGTLVCEVEITPKPLSFCCTEIAIQSAWLERRPIGGFALCFRVGQGKEVFQGPDHPFFVLDDRDAGFEERHGRGWLQIIERLDSDDLSSIRATLIRHWNDERQKNIRFVRKGK